MRLTRRGLLRGDGLKGSIHISSLVVHCRPEAVNFLIDAINALPEAEVPEHSAEGKLVVLLETPNQGVIMNCVNAIEALAGVINVSMAYHQVDTESESETEPETGTIS
jgi:periplasmic nitrate reductase NapD